MSIYVYKVCSKTSKTPYNITKLGYLHIHPQCKYASNSNNIGRYEEPYDHYNRVIARQTFRRRHSNLFLTPTTFIFICRGMPSICGTESPQSSTRGSSRGPLTTLHPLQYTHQQVFVMLHTKNIIKKKIPEIMNKLSFLPNSSLNLSPSGSTIFGSSW
jgi:hypothetical protein